jgi:hypothetical protein
MGNFIKGNPSKPKGVINKINTQTGYSIQRIFYDNFKEIQRRFGISCAILPIYPLLNGFWFTIYYINSTLKEKSMIIFNILKSRIILKIIYVCKQNCQ